MDAQAQITPNMFLQNITAVVTTPNWGIYPTGFKGGTLAFGGEPDRLRPLAPLVSIEGGERTVRKTGKDSYAGTVARVDLEEKELRPTHGILSAVYTLERLIRTRSATALSTADKAHRPFDVKQEVRMRLMGDRSFERIGLIAREDNSGAMRKLTAGLAMDFVIATEEAKEADIVHSAKLAFLAGMLFATSKTDSWQSRSASSFDASSRLFLTSGMPALSAITGEIAILLAGPSAGPRRKGRKASYSTAEIVSCAWNHVMKSPSVSERQRNIALFRGLTAALQGQVWYQAMSLYEADAGFNDGRKAAAKGLVRAAWAEAIDVVNRGTPFPATDIEFRLRSALMTFKGFNAEKERKAINLLLWQASQISERFRVKK